MTPSFRPLSIAVGQEAGPHIGFALGRLSPTWASSRSKRRSRSRPSSTWSKACSSIAAYISPYFVTNADKMRVELEDPYILIYGEEAVGPARAAPLLESVVQTGKPLLHRRRGRGRRSARHPRGQQAARRLKVAAVKARASAIAARPCCKDIAVLTGGQAISEDLGIKLENVTLQMLGRAKKVMIEKENTTIVNGAGKKADIEARISQIKAQIEENHLGLRQGEAAGASRQARGRRRGDPRRWCDRDRGEGAQGSRG